MADDIITRDDNGDLAVNVVTSTEGNVPYNYDDCFTLDTNGRRALRVVGAGGGDSHNKGYFATQSALEEAYPTGEAGDYAIVGSTDTVWIWDEDTSAWVDSDQKGQVTSVNGQTGAVTVSEVPSQTGYSGRVLGTDGFVAGWVVPEKVQRSTMPQASEEEVDNIYQYVGTTDANYTNGYFYKCVSDGQNPATYSWTRVDVQPTPDPLPSQTGQNGKFLTTNGTTASWGTVESLPTQTGNAGKFLTTDGTDASWSDEPLVEGFNTVTGNTTFFRSGGYQSYNIVLGANANTSQTTPNNGVSFYGAGNKLYLCSYNMIGNGGLVADTVEPYGSNKTLGVAGVAWESVYVKKINTGNGADISVPTTGGTMSVQVSSLPTAASTNEGQIYQYIGATDSTYTNGRFYKCVSDGQSTPTYSWEEVSMGGGNYLPLTGGTLTGPLDFDGSNDYYIKSDPNSDGFYIGWHYNSSTDFDVLKISNGNINAGRNGITDLGVVGGKFRDIYGTNLIGTYIKQYGGNNITIPATGGTMVVADYTGASQGDVLTLDSNGNAVWAAGGGGSLPSQTGNAGKFLTTDGTDASWSDKPLVNTATGMQATSINGSASSSYFATNVGFASQAVGNGATSYGRGSFAYTNGTAIGYGATAWTNTTGGIALGANTKTDADYAIQIGSNGNQTTNSDANTFKVANENGNFEMMNANGNLPADRLASTTGLADGNYRLRLTMASGVPTLSWVAE